MFKDFLNHRCNIYHLKEEQVNTGYGMQPSAVSVPDTEAGEKDVPCHFHVRSHSLQIVQNEPMSNLEGEVKLSLPYGTDIRENDMVESVQSGHWYRAGIPRVIAKNHHIIVQLSREEGVRGAL